MEKQVSIDKPTNFEVKAEEAQRGTKEEPVDTVKLPRIASSSQDEVETGANQASGSSI